MKGIELVVRGKTISPIVTKDPMRFFVKQYKGFFRAGYRTRAYNKVTKDVPTIPFSWLCYYGEIELKMKTKSKKHAERKLDELLEIRHIGKYTKNGMGQVQWCRANLVKMFEIKNRKPRYQMKLRRGLPHNLPQIVKDLIVYSLLHDFFRCENDRGTIYPSKIIYEPAIKDDELVRKIKLSHLATSDELVNIFKPYDRLAAYITRRKKSVRKNRMNWFANKLGRNVDFQSLANKIAEVFNTCNEKNKAYKLYEYVYNSIELKFLNEALEYGHTSLRTHLLIIVNLIVQDFLRGEMNGFLKCTSYRWLD